MDEVDAAVDLAVQIALVQLLEIVGILDIGQDQGQGVDGLAPLVGDVAHHLAHGGEA